MKKFLALVLVLLTVFCFAACDDKNNDKSQTVLNAIEELKDYWKEELARVDSMLDSQQRKISGYFEIKNTRLITIKENDIDVFKDVAYVVEFILYTDYYGVAPYYVDAERGCVNVYKDGSMEVTTYSIIMQYSAQHGRDVLDFIQSIDDYGDKYNCVETLQFK